MDTKMFDKNLITLDGRMNEPVWDSVPEQTGFYLLKSRLKNQASVQTSFKILPCKDCIIVGVKCEEPDMEYCLKENPLLPTYNCDAVEVFMSPTCNYFDFYQFVITFEGKTATHYYSEGGNIQPDPYAPEWHHAVYRGENYWSVEIEFPLKAFYMTADDVWSDRWLFNVCRSRIYRDKDAHRMMFTSWSWLDNSYRDSRNYRSLDGFPKRPKADDLRISSAVAEICDETEQGFCGEIVIKTVNAVDGDFEFASECTEPVTVSLKTGANEFKLPCCFARKGRQRLMLQLKRLSDGETFKRWYPVFVQYDAIKLTFTQPEFRCNFYPGQDYTKVAGKVIANKPATLTLEGVGIPKQILTPEADGSFCFETPGFEFGEAFLTVTTEDRTLSQKIRRLPPTDHMMTWISGGNLIVNGKAVLRRTMYAEYYAGGEAFKRRYDADNLHDTRYIRSQAHCMQPDLNLKRAGLPMTETTKDEKPSQWMYDFMDKILERNKDRDFAYYYLSDEPECRGLSHVYLKHLYDYITEKDPYHVVLLGTRACDRFNECGDWFESHPYINAYTAPNGRRVYGRAIHSQGKDIDDIVKLGRSDKCAGFLPTCYGARKDKPDFYPTFDEYICHTWAAMIRGGKSLWPYAYHDMNDRAALYEGTRYVFSTFEALEDIVLFAKRTTLYRTLDVEAALYETEKEKMFVIVNMTQDPQEVTLDAITGTWHNFRHGGTVSGSVFALKPHEVVIGTTEVRDAGLPTYEEVVELIAKLEYQRTHRGNLLFDRHTDVSITATSAVGLGLKLFDGVRDNYGWACNTDSEKFMELNLTKVNPTFTKVAVYGYQIDDMRIRIKNGEELKAPDVADVKTEEYAKIFTLQDAVTPDALRLEFGTRRVEVYEIELN